MEKLASFFGLKKESENEDKHCECACECVESCSLNNINAYDLEVSVETKIENGVNAIIPARKKKKTVKK